MYHVRQSNGNLFIRILFRKIEFISYVLLKIHSVCKTFNPIIFNILLAKCHCWFIVHCGNLGEKHRFLVKKLVPYCRYIIHKIRNYNIDLSKFWNVLDILGCLRMCMCNVVHTRKKLTISFNFSLFSIYISEIPLWIIVFLA